MGGLQKRTGGEDVEKKKEKEALFAALFRNWRVKDEDVRHIIRHLD